MNRLFYLTLILLSLTFIACGGDDDGNNPSDDNFFTATVDGNEYRVEDDLFAYGTIFSTDNTLGIYGVEGDNSSITRTLYLIVDDAGTAGTYDLSFGAEGTGFYVVTNGETYTTIDPVGNGVLEITERTEERVKGTFSFTAVTTNGETIEITNGSFDVGIR